MTWGNQPHLQGEPLPQFQGNRCPGLPKTTLIQISSKLSEPQGKPGWGRNGKRVRKFPLTQSTQSSRVSLSRTSRPTAQTLSQLWWVRVRWEVGLGCAEVGCSKGFNNGGRQSNVSKRTQGGRFQIDYRTEFSKKVLRGKVRGSCRTSFSKGLQASG